MNTNNMVTKFFTAGSEAVLTFLVQSYIKSMSYKGYVLHYQSPISKGLFGLLTTSVTLMKID